MICICLLDGVILLKHIQNIFSVLFQTYDRKTMDIHNFKMFDFIPKADENHLPNL